MPYELCGGSSKTLTGFEAVIKTYDAFMFCIAI